MSDLFTDVPANLATIQAALGSGPNSIPGCYRIDAAHFPKWLEVLNKVRSGVSGARGRIGFVGDSTFHGYMSSGGPANWRAQCIPTRMKELVASRMGVVTIDNAFFSDHNHSYAEIMTYDSRLVIPAAFVKSSKTVAGSLMQSSAAGVLTFAPETAFDRIRPWYGDFSGTGDFTVNINGGATLATVDTDGVGFTGFDSATVNCTLGTNTINLERSAGTIYLSGIEAWASGTPSLSFINLGASGWTSSFWAEATSLYSPKPALQKLAFDLTFIMLGANDKNLGTASLATIISNLDGLITAAKAGGGDVCLIIQPRAKLGYATGNTPNFVTETDLRTALLALAATRDVPLIDLYVRHPAITGQPWWLDDDVHFTKAGNNDHAWLITEVLARIS